MQRTQKFPAELSLAKIYGYLAIIFFLCSFPFSLYFPLWISWENQILENTQAAVLAFGALTALFFAFKCKGKMRTLWFSIIPIWFIMFARELSWGAVFYPPTYFSDEGPFFPASQLWYHPYRTPFVLLLIVGITIGFYISNAPRIFYNLVTQRKFPFFCIFGFVIAMLFSTAAENHLSLSLSWWPGYHQIIEETMELAAFIFLLSAQQHVWESLSADSDYPEK